MKNNNFSLNLFKKSPTKYNNDVVDQNITTDINILLNRVKVNKKIEFKQKIIFTSLLLFFTSSLAVFLFFQ